MYKLEIIERKQRYPAQRCTGLSKVTTRPYDDESNGKAMEMNYYNNILWKKRIIDDTVYYAVPKMVMRATRPTKSPAQELATKSRRLCIHPRGLVQLYDK